MIKGGYQIIDLKNHNFEASIPFHIEAVYDLIESTRKAILISGLVIGGAEYHDIFTSVTISAGNFVFIAYGKTFTVKADDTITMA